MLFFLGRRGKNATALVLCENRALREQIRSLLNQALRHEYEPLHCVLTEPPVSLFRFLRQKYQKEFAEKPLGHLLHLDGLDGFLQHWQDGEWKTAPTAAQINMERELLLRELPTLAVWWMDTFALKLLHTHAIDLLDWLKVFEFKLPEDQKTKLPPIEDQKDRPKPLRSKERRGTN